MENYALAIANYFARYRRTETLCEIHIRVSVRVYGIGISCVVLVWLVVVRLYVKRYCSCVFNNHHHRQCHRYIRLCGAILVPFKAEIK